jgi:hypothetical protein
MADMISHTLGLQTPSVGSEPTMKSPVGCWPALPTVNLAAQQTHYKGTSKESQPTAQGPGVGMAPNDI